MAESCGGISETKRIVVNPRVEIDTSPPFESVKEAVDRFGGSGPWIPHHLLRVAAAHHHGNEAFDMEKMEKQAIQLERDLSMKEQQTLNVLKELESAKRYVEALKLNFMPELSSFLSSPDHKLESVSPGLMFMELNQAKSTLNKTSIDLAAIQASVECLNKKMRKDKALELTHDQVEVAKSPDIIISKQVNFEAEQFKNMTEASRYEVMKAMTEIERTKNSIKMAEMRLNAAKKMEEAAKAVEAIALAERKIILDGEDSSSPTDGITLSFEEYESLIQKAKQGQELCKTKCIDDRLEVPILEKFENPTKPNNSSSKFMFRNSHKNPHILNGNGSNTKREKKGRGFRSTTLIGDLLTRKLILQDDITVERRVEEHSERERVSLSQMLMEKSRLILHPPSKQTMGDGNGNHVEKQYFVQRKKFGFIQVPIPTKHSSKKKSQPAMNMIR